MKTINVGAFEAKTRFSELLRQVERGCVVHVLRRNKHVADLVRRDDSRFESAGQALERLRSRRRLRAGMSAAEIAALRDEGRKR